jgi:hypothetical protein
MALKHEYTVIVLTGDGKVLATITEQPLFVNAVEDMGPYGGQALGIEISRSIVEHERGTK